MHKMKLEGKFLERLDLKMMPFDRQLLRIQAGLGKDGSVKIGHARRISGVCDPERIKHWAAEILIKLLDVSR